MRKVIIISLVMVFISCSNFYVSDFKSHSIRSKGKTFDWMDIEEYSFSQLDTIARYGIIPKGKTFSDYHIESSYVDCMIDELYAKLQKEDRFKSNLKTLEDSLTNAYPKKVSFNEIDLLSDNKVKFRKYVENIDNCNYSSKVYVLKEIVKPNMFYRFRFGTTSNDHKRDNDFWIEIIVNSKKEIIYWKEIKYKLKTKQQDSLKNL